MKSYHRHKHKLTHTLLRESRRHLKFFLYFAALVLILIGNNFASLRGNDQLGPEKYMGESRSLENNKGLGGVQQGLTSVQTNVLLKPKLDIVKQLQTESTFPYPWINISGSGGQWEKLYVQSAVNPQNNGLGEGENYLLASLGSSAGSHQNIGEGGSGSSLSVVNQNGGEANPAGPFIGSLLEYPHSSNYVGGYNEGSVGGSPGLSGSGGGGGSGPILLIQANGDPPQVPEPSTFILTAIGLLLVAWRAATPRPLKSLPAGRLEP